MKGGERMERRVIYLSIKGEGVKKGMTGQEDASLVSRPHFSRPPEKWVWSTAYSIFVQVRRNVGALFFSNLTFDVIKDCIPHCV